jgi:tetratricopeptide (TPR) repeat protein
MFRRRQNPIANRLGRGLIDQELSKAILLFNQGQYAEAGAIFERIAEIAAARNGPRAPRFFLEAGRALFHARQPERALQLLERGWKLALANGRLGLLTRVGPGLSAEIGQLGYADQARGIQSWLAKIPAAPLPMSATATKRPELPLKCPSCGAPVRPNEVEWLDEQTAECDFCGNPMRGS